MSTHLRRAKQRSFIFAVAASKSQLQMNVLVMNEDRLDCVQGRTELSGASDRTELNIEGIRLYISR